MKCNKVNISKQGPQFSDLIFGAWRLCDDPSQTGSQHVIELIDHCLEWGINTFDHADIYGDYQCEKAFGKALKERSSIRQNIKIITKAGIKLISSQKPEHQVKHYDTSPEHLKASVETSLRHLNTDYIDLFLIHRPDPFMNYEATAKTLEDLVDSGKVAHLGVSNFLPHQLDTLQSMLSKPLVTNQIELNCLNLQAFHDGSLEQAQRLQRRPLAWSPLAGGRIFDSKHANSTQQNLVQVLQNLASQKNATVGQIALAWVREHPSGAIPIIGTQKISRIKELVAASETKLTRQEWYQIYSASLGTEVP